MTKLNPISRPNKLTAAQAAVLSVAAQRLDGALVLPVRLKGKAATALGSSLIEDGLAREMRAKPGLPAWRQDGETGKSFALLITKAGRVAAPALKTETPVAEQDGGSSTTVQVSDVRQPSETEISEGWSAQTAADGLSASGGIHPQSSSAPQASAPRPDTKLSGVIKLLERETGATIDELIAATGWLPHTTRAAMTGLRKRGFAVTSERQHGAQTTYRIGSAPATQAA